MEINFTLMLQAVHFFIAYCMVRFLLLKPVMNLIYKKRTYELSLQNVISQLEESVLDAQQTQRKVWLNCKQFFLKNHPDSTDEQLYMFTNITPDVAAVDILPEEKEEAVQTIAEFVRASVGRVK